MSKKSNSGILGGLQITELMRVATRFMTIDLVTRMVGQLNLPGLPKFVPSLMTLIIAVARLAAIKPLTSGLPPIAKPLVKSMLEISTLQIVFSQLPQLINSMTSAAAPTQPGGAGFLQT